MLATEVDDVFFRHIPYFGLESNEGTGCFAPLLIRTGNHRRFHHRRVAIECVFHFDGGDVFATRDDDVFQSVLDFDVAVFMPYGQVTGVEPAAAESFFCGTWVLQVTFHHSITAQEDLANGFAIFRDRLHGVGVSNQGAAQSVVTNSLASL